MSEQQWYCEGCNEDLTDDAVRFTEDDVPVCIGCYDSLIEGKADDER